MPVTRSSGLNVRRYWRHTTYLQMATAAGFLVTVTLALLPR